MSDTVAHYFRSLRRVAEDHPDSFHMDKIDETEKAAAALADGYRFDGKARLKAWDVIAVALKPPKKLMPRVVAELKKWKCHDIKVTVDRNHCYELNPEKKPDSGVYCFAYNITFKLHCGGTGYCRIIMDGIHSEPLIVAASGRYQMVGYRIMYAFSNTKNKPKQFTINELVDRPHRIRDKIADMMAFMHDDILTESNADHESYIIQHRLRAMFGDASPEDIAYYEPDDVVAEVSNYLETHTLLDDYVPSRWAILSEFYTMANPFKDNITPAPAKDASIIIHNNIDVPVRLYDPNGKFIGMILNEAAFMDVCCQIKEKEVPGYYVMYGKHKITIGSDGTVSEQYPDGFFNAFVDMNGELL